MYSILATILSIPITFAVGGSTIPTTPTTPIGGVTFDSPFGTGGTVQSVLNNLIDYATLIAAPIATVMVIYGAFQILTASGNPSQVAAGGKTIKYALGGIALVVVARLLVSIVSGIIQGLT